MLRIAAISLSLLACVPSGAMAQNTKPIKGGEAWGANYFPNVELTNQDGQKVRFFDDMVKDKIVLISFIYTSCPDACPLETARIAEVQGILGDRIGKDVFFYSITIDPAHDTPAVLKEYAQRYQAGPGWQFLTGDKDQIGGLRMKLGLYDPTEELQLSDHGLNIIIGNQTTGRWMRSSPFENPYVMAAQIGEWLNNWKLPRKNDRDYKDAPEIRQIGAGEVVFRQRCNSCHAIGGTNTQLARLGPNLFGVNERRTHDWLVRWLMEPDKMLAEKDPIATSMFEAYNKVAMPNNQLTRQQAEDLIAYLGEESQRVASAPPPGKDGEPQEAPHSCCQKKDHVVVGDEADKPAEAAVAAAPAKEPTEPPAAARSETAETAPATADASPGRAGGLSPLSLASIGIGLVVGVFALLRARGASAFAAPAAD